MVSLSFERRREQFLRQRIGVALPAHELSGEFRARRRCSGVESIIQQVFGGLAQPEFRDALAPRQARIGIRGQVAMPGDRLLQLVESFSGNGAGADHGGGPVGWFVPEGSERQHLLQIGQRPVGVAAVAFRHDVDVGDLQKARFDRLDLVAEAGRGDHHRGVGSLYDLDLVLAHADGFQNDDPETGGIENIGRPRGPRAPCRRSPRASPCCGYRRRGSAPKVAHADAVSQDGAARIRRGRIDRDDADLIAAGAQSLRQPADECGFSAAGTPVTPTTCARPASL